MGSRWDPVLPYLAPSRGLGPTATSSSFREPALGSPRSASPDSSSDGYGSGQGSPRDGSQQGGGLPNTEDIYDLPAGELRALESHLSERIKSGLAGPREERLHMLVTVELSERRSVEEIGLALVGGRFDFERVPIAPPVCTQEASGASIGGESVESLPYP